MGSTRINQNFSINKTNWKCTCDNDIGCLSILLGEGEDSGLPSTSLLTGGYLTKTSGTTSAMPLLGYKLSSTLRLSWRQLIRSWSYTADRLLRKLLMLITKIRA